MKRTAILMVIAAMAAGCAEGGIGAGPAQQITATRGELTAVIVKKGPVVDGTLDSPVWQKCPPLTLGRCQSSDPSPLKTTARVVLDERNIYVAWECLEPDPASIKTNITQRDGTIWNDDCVDFFICPDPTAGYYHFLINPKGVLLDGKGRVGGLGDEEDTSWNSSAVVKTSVQKDRWIVTMSVPLRELGAYVGENQTWAMNINRSRPLGSNQWEESSWSAEGRSKYHDSDGWGKLTGVRVVRRADGVTREAPAPKK